MGLSKKSKIKIVLIIPLVVLAGLFALAAVSPSEPSTPTPPAAPGIATDIVIKCNLFCDSNEYEPRWTKNMGKNQAVSKCENIFINEVYGSADFQWCQEYIGYLLD